MKALWIAQKSLRELWREPLLLGLLLFFPMALVGFYYFAFGQTAQGLATYLAVLVINEDAGAGQWQAGEDMVEAVRAAEWEGDPVFDVQVVDDRAAAETALRERKAALLLSIPADFSERLVAGPSSPGSDPVVTLLGDTTSGNYAFAFSFLHGLVRAFGNQVAGLPEDTLTIDYEFLPGTGTMSDFDWGVGGIIVFGVMFVSVTTATVLVRENVTGTLRRLRLTLAGASALLLGVGLAQMATAAVQIPITFGTAVALGFRSNGSLLLVMAIGFILTLSAVGLGLIVACFARNDGDAANLASGLMVPTIFLSGALFPMPEVALFVIGARTVQLYDVLPAAHAAEAMRRVMIFGQGPGDIAYELVAMTALSAITLALGIGLYHRLRMQVARG